MAAAFIAIDKTKTYGNSFWADCRNLVAVVQNLRLHLDSQTSMKDGEVYTLIEAQYGLPTGAGAGVYSALSALVTALEGNAQIAAIRASLGPIRG